MLVASGQLHVVGSSVRPFIPLTRFIGWTFICSSVSFVVLFPSLLVAARRPSQHPEPVMSPACAYGAPMQLIVDQMSGANARRHPHIPFWGGFGRMFLAQSRLWQNHSCAESGDPSMHSPSRIARDGSFSRDDNCTVYCCAAHLNPCLNDCFPAPL